MNIFVDAATMARIEAAASRFTVNREGEDFRVSWGAEPLDFAIQTRAQLLDLAAQIEALTKK